MVFEIILVWIHLVAATFWVGGMLFLSLVAVPCLKKASDPALAQREFLSLARRFRMLVWVALLLLIVTGGILLPNHVDFSMSFGNWPFPVFVKLMLVCLLIVVSLSHDQFIGPKVRLIKQKPASVLTGLDKTFLRLSPLISRLTMVIGLAILLAAASMVRS